LKKLKKAAEDADDIVNLFTMNSNKNTSRPFPKKFEMTPVSERPPSMLVSEQEEAQAPKPAPKLYATAVVCSRPAEESKEAEPNSVNSRLKEMAMLR
jgi:hypothetical protein